MVRKYIRSVTRRVVAWLTASEDLTTGTAVQLEYPSAPSPRDSGNLLFAALWEPDGEEILNALPTVGHGRALKEEELSRLIFGTQHGIQVKESTAGFWTAGESPQRSHTILRRINSPLCALSLSGPCPTTLNTYSLGKVTWEKLQTERFVLYSSFRWTRGLIF